MGDRSVPDTSYLLRHLILCSTLVQVHHAEVVPIIAIIQVNTIIYSVYKKMVDVQSMRLGSCPSFFIEKDFSANVSYVVRHSRIVGHAGRAE